MSKIEPAQSNQKLMRLDVFALPVEFATLKLSMLAMEAWYYDVPILHVTVGS